MGRTEYVNNGIRGAGYEESRVCRKLDVERTGYGQNRSRITGPRGEQDKGRKWHGENRILRRQGQGKNVIKRKKEYGKNRILRKQG